jgi:hypothetical protein
MHRTFVQSLVAAAIGAAIAAPAAAGPPERYSYTAESATAFFYSSSDCVVTSVLIFEAIDGLRGQKPNQEAFSSVSVIVSQYDECQSESLHDIGGISELEAADFAVTDGGRSATLAATADVYDYVTDPPSPVQLTLDVSWSATSLATQLHSTSIYHEPGFMSIGRGNGRSRSATATGTISDGTTNFTPGPSTDAGIDTNASGGIIRFGP